MLWHHPDYDSYDLSSLAVVVYAGSAVDTEFLRKLSRMAPDFGTGIGMTENAGFATFTPRGIPIEEMAGQVGRAFPDLAKVTIRRPMLPDGQAGPELPDGEVGEICYHPPIVFFGILQHARRDGADHFQGRHPLHRRPGQFQGYGQLSRALPCRTPQVHDQTERLQCLPR
jgi:acyl-CoA synthetase (AMP-forming)/AMP-acid ligase II